jgi:ketosteroid isomerase-like protein
MPQVALAGRIAGPFPEGVEVMRHFLSSLCFVAVLGLAAGCASPPQGPSAEEMVAAANTLDQEFVAAFNSGDVEAMNGLYWNSPDAITFPPDAMVAHGFEAISEGNARMLASLEGARLELTESHEIPAGDVVLGWGLWHMTMPGPDGATVELSGRYTDVKAERDGKWVYLMDHASVPLPATPEN